MWLRFVIILQVCVCCSEPKEEPTMVSHSTHNPRNDSIANEILKRAARFLDGNDSQLPSDQLRKDEIDQLRDGDILLRRGYGMVSDFIASYLDEEFPVTHCAFFYRNNQSKPFVLHCISNDSIDGIFTEPLEQFIEQSKASSLVAIRLKTDSIGVRTYMNRAFDLLQRDIPFDMSFDDSDSSKMYCVEMMRHAFYPVFKRDILYKRANHLGIHVTHMDNFFNDTLFTTVFNHFKTH